jgi:hypothetical protein
VVRDAFTFRVKSVTAYSRYFKNYLYSLCPGVMLLSFLRSMGAERFIVLGPCVESKEFSSSFCFCFCRSLFLVAVCLNCFS